MWIAIVRGYTLKIDQQDRKISRLELQTKRRRESRTVLDHEMDKFLFRDIKVAVEGGGDNTAKI